jgi:hypothetical protein
LKLLWQFRNDFYHQDNEGTIARYTLEALERDMEKLWARHIEPLPKLWDFKNSTSTGDNASWTYGMKARNAGQR